MNVVLNVVWHVIVDDVLDHGEVETLRGNVRCHQYILVAPPVSIINRSSESLGCCHSRSLFGFKVKPKPRCVKTARNVAFAFTLKSNTVNSVFVVQLYYSYNRKKGHFMRLEIKRK